LAPLSIIATAAPIIITSLIMTLPPRFEQGKRVLVLTQVSILAQVSWPGQDRY